MTRAHTQPKRVPPGRPSGGQFATMTRPEADIDLGTIPSPRGIGSIDADRVADPLTRALVQIEKSAAHWARDDREEEELNAAALDDLSRHGAAHLASMTPSAIHRSVRYIRDRATTGNTSGPDYEAWRKFDELRRDEENARGRQLTSAEEDDLAERVRMCQAPGRRGRIGFHRPGVRVVSIHGNGDRPGPLDALEAPEPWTDGDTPLRECDDDPDFSTNKDKNEPFDAFQARHISSLTREIGRWQTYARYTGAPDAAPRTLTESRAAAYRKVICDAHGAAAVATDYLNGRVVPGDEVAEALFKPFGDLPEGQRRSLAAQLARLPHAKQAGAQDPAHMLWDDAVRVATKVKPRKSNGGLA